jgi:hypothetical protein
MDGRRPVVTRVHRTRPTGQLARRLNWKPRIAQGMEVVRLSASAGDPRGLGSGDLPSLAELIRQTRVLIPSARSMSCAAMSSRTTRNSSTSWPSSLPHATPALPRLGAVVMDTDVA